MNFIEMPERPSYIKTAKMVQHRLERGDYVFYSFHIQKPKDPKFVDRSKHFLKKL
jgi:hypothetical protein